MKQGVIKLSDYSPVVTPEQQQKIEALSQELLNDKQIFSGKLYDNQGNLKCNDGEAISENVLLERMNWLVRGVEVLE